MTEFSLRRTRVFLGALALAASMAVPAFAAEPAAGQPKPAETTSTHDDWTVRCVAGKSGKECEATQTLQTADMKGVLAHVAVRAQKGGPVYLIVLVPPGVWLPANVTLKVAGVSDLALTYKRCGQHCVASRELTQEDQTALKASAGTGDLMFEDGSRHPIILPVSFKGLGAAMLASLNG